MTLAPYPVDTRAKGWRFELDHERIRQSDTWALATPEIRPWLLMLWMTAWEQTPCGSLPNDDELIAARIGMPIEQFTACRNRLMRGWWLADDGRLYHDTMAERVLDMLGRRDGEKSRKAAYRARKEAERAAEQNGAGQGGPEQSHGNTAASRVRPEMSHGTDAGQTQESHGTDATGTGTGTSNKKNKTPLSGKPDGEGEKSGHVDPDPQGADMGSDNALEAVDAETKPVEAIFAYWQKVMASPRSVLDDKRRKAIRAALKWGYTPRQLCVAIRGCSKTPHNMGKNDRGQKFNGLELILRSADQVDRFIANDSTPIGTNGNADPFAWALTWSGIVAKGGDMGLTQGDTEQNQAFKARVYTAAGITDADRSRLFADHGVSI